MGLRITLVLDAATQAALVRQAEALERAATALEAIQSSLEGTDEPVALNLSAGDASPQ